MASVDLGPKDRDRSPPQIDRLTIRCHAPGVPNAASVTAVERRLRRIASTSLPPKLERLMPSNDQVVERLTVPLAFSLDDYDDETVAWLWATAVAAEARAAVRPTAVLEPPPSRFDEDDDASADPPAADDREAGAAAAGIRPGGGSNPEAGRGRARLLDRLAQALAHASTEAAADAIRAEAERLEPTVSTPSLEPGERPEPDLPGVNQRSAPAEQTSTARSAPRATSGEEAALLADGLSDSELAALVAEVEADRDVPAAASVEPATRPPRRFDQPAVSNVGGVVLLYPWLRTLIEKAWELNAASPEVAAAVLLAACSPGSGPALTGAADPLLGVLAGCDPGTAIDRRQVREVDLGPLEDDLDDVFGRFSAALGGTWTRPSLVAELVARSATIERSNRAWVVTPSPRPLDVLLGRLPYPLSFFAFPWTDPIFVRWPHES